MDQIEVCALRNVHIGQGRDLQAGERGLASGADAAFLLQIEAVKLVNPADEERIAAAIRQDRARADAQAFRDRHS